MARPPHYAIDSEAEGQVVLVPAATDEEVKLRQYTITTDAAAYIRWLSINPKTGVATNLSGKMRVPADGSGLTEPLNEDGYLRSLPGEALGFQQYGTAVLGGYANCLQAK